MDSSVNKYHKTSKGTKLRKNCISNINYEVNNSHEEED